MKYHPITTSKFVKDYARIKKRGKNLEKLKIAAQYRDHALTGECAGCRECHIEPDWLLMYEIKGDDMVFLHTGTDSDLFE